MLIKMNIDELSYLILTTHNMETIQHAEDVLITGVRRSMTIANKAVPIGMGPTYCITEPIIPNAPSDVWITAASMMAPLIWNDKW